MKRAPCFKSGVSSTTSQAKAPHATAQSAMCTTEVMSKVDLIHMEPQDCVFKQAPAMQRHITLVAVVRTALQKRALRRLKCSIRAAPTTVKAKFAPTRTNIMSWAAVRYSDKKKKQTRKKNKTPKNQNKAPKTTTRRKHRPIPD